MLYYTILYYTILCYAMLCYAMLHYTILYYTILYYTMLYYTMPILQPDENLLVQLFCPCLGGRAPGIFAGSDAGQYREATFLKQFGGVGQAVYRPPINSQGGGKLFQKLCFSVPIWSVAWPQSQGTGSGWESQLELVFCRKNAS